MRINCISSYAVRHMLGKEFKLEQMAAEVKKRYGFADIEIVDGDLRGNLESRALDVIVAGLEQVGGRCVNLPVNVGDVSRLNEKGRLHDIDVIEKYFAVAKYIGCPRVRVNTDKRVKLKEAADMDDQAIVRVADSFKRLADSAEKYGVQLILENHGGLSKDINNILWLLDQVGRDRLALCADFGGLPAESRYDDLAAMLPFAQIVHAKYIEKDGKVPFDWPRCVQVVKASGFTGPISVEIDGYPGNGWEMIDKIIKLWDDSWQSA